MVAGRRPLVVAVLSLGFIVLAGAARAQAVTAQQQAAGADKTPLTAQQLSLGATTAPRRLQTGKDFFSGPALERCPFHTDDLKYSFQLNGVDVEYHEKEAIRRLSNTAVEASYASFKGKTIAPQDICAIRDNLQNSLFKAGIFARVLIYDQTIQGGVVRFTIIEAQIVHVRYVGKSIGPAQELVESYLDHLAHEPFDLFRVQRYLLLANDIPGVRALASVARSTDPRADPGSMDLVVSLSRTPLQEVAAIENYSANTLGPWSGIARLDVNSLTALGDHTTLVAYTSLGDETQQVVQLIEEIRLGSKGLYAQASFAYGHSTPGDVLAPAKLESDSTVGTFQLDAPLSYGLHNRVLLSAGMDFVDQTTVFPGGGDLTDDHLRILWAKLYGRADRAFSSDASVLGRMLGSDVRIAGESEFEVRKGVDGLGSSRANGPALSRPAGRADAVVLRSDGTATIALTPVLPYLPPVGLSFRYMAQWSDRPLLSYEESPIGNLTIGYGYDPAAVSGDRVIAGEVVLALGPLRFPINLAPGLDISVKPFGFFDDAYVNNLDPGSENVMVRSAGAGIEFGLLNHFHGYNVKAVIRYAQPLDKTFPNAIAKPPARALFQIIVLH